MDEKNRMRRIDRQIADVNEIVGVVAACRVCRLGMIDEGEPYIVPLNFGYEYTAEGKLVLYFHSAREGRKMRALRASPRVCFEMYVDNGLIEADVPCKHSYAFESVIGWGDVEFFEDAAEKTRALNLIMLHQTGKPAEFSYPEAMLAAVALYRVTADSFTGKRRSR